MPVMAYFTDLAELVSKIEKPHSRFYLDNESDSMLKKNLFSVSLIVFYLEPISDKACCQQ